MKVFISWSGEPSKKIAEAFRQWIPGVIQAAKPYYTPDDITKGTRWSTEIAKELDASKVGIICLTRNNLNSPWIMFEAGALSKNLEKSKVCPLLFDLEPSEIEGPLIQFQAAKFSKIEMKKVVKMINLELGDNSLTNEVLDGVFDMWWPKLESQIKEILKNGTEESEEDLRSDREMLEEILFLSRRLSIDKPNKGDSKIHPGAIEDLIEGSCMVANESITSGYFNLDAAMDTLLRPIDYIITENRDSLSRNQLDHMYQRLTEVRTLMDDLKMIKPEKPKKFVIRKKPEKED